MGARHRQSAHSRHNGRSAEGFLRDEVNRLAPLAGRAPFGALRELSRIVSTECAVEIDTNSYSVPWRLIGERVAVTIAAGQVRIRHGAKVVAVHAQVQGRRQRVINAAHLDGVAGRDGPVRRCGDEVMDTTPLTLSRSR